MLGKVQFKADNRGMRTEASRTRTGDERPAMDAAEKVDSEAAVAEATCPLPQQSGLWVQPERIEGDQMHIS